MGADFSQFYAYRKKFKHMRQDFDNFGKDFLVEMAQRVVALAKQNTRVDTGALRAMFGIGEEAYQSFISQNPNGMTNEEWDGGELQLDISNATVSKDGTKLQIAVWNGMEYASDIEFGHKTRGGGSFVAGDYMLTIAINEIQNEMPARFQAKFKKFMAQRGIGI